MRISADEVWYRSSVSNRWQTTQRQKDTFLMRKTLSVLALAAATSIGVLAGSGAANAATAPGFLGKGEVQTALGWNNAALQKAVTTDGAIKFTSEQALTQSVSQDATQSGTRVGTQSVSQDLSCTIEGKNKTFHRDGLRDGVATGTADGTRTGSRSGVANGTVASTIQWDARKTGQFTGFYLAAPVVTGTTWGQPSAFGDYQFGDYAFGDYAFGAPVWGDWVAEPGENPADCLRTDTGTGTPVVTDLSNVITPGAITDGEVTDGAITEGAVSYGPVVTGATTLFVNGKPLA